MRVRKITVIGLIVLLVAAILDFVNFGPEVLVSPFELTFRQMLTKSDLPQGGFQGEPVYEESGALEQPAEGIDQLVMQRNYGTLVVAPAEDDRLSIQYVKKVNGPSEEKAKDFAEQVEIELVKTGSSLYLQVKRPEFQPDGVDGFGMDLEMRIPDGLVSRLDNFGDTTVRSLKGSVHLQQRGGDLIVEELDGNLDLNSSFSRVFLGSIRGDVDVHHKYEEIQIVGVTGELRGDIGFAETHVGRIGKGVNLDVAYANGDYEDIGGDLRLNGKFSAVKAGDLQGALWVRSKHGNVDVTGLKQDGDVAVEFGSLSLGLKEGAGWTVDARCQFGRIQSQFDLNQSKEANGESAKGQIADGQQSLRLLAEHGDITIHEVR